MAKKAAPKKKAAAKKTPLKKKAAAKKTAPKKRAEPKKKTAPKKATPKKKTAPKKVTPKKETAPKKKATPKKKTAPTKATPKKKTAPKKKAKRKPNAAFMKPLIPDEVLGAIVGSKALPRTEVTRKVWAYIKKNNLQDTQNKRMINADAKLKELFDGQKQVSMFDMTKLYGKHLSN